jgi:GcrA cell cycle regulator
MSLPSSSAPSRGTWSDAAVETLTVLWTAGDLSAAAIARRLGVTRNAVLGKVHRLGLSQGRSPRPRLSNPKRAKPRPRRAPARPPPATRLVTGQAQTREATAAVPHAPLAARLEDLPAHACRWPIGDPKRPDFGFCGRRVEAGPYCGPHRGLAYQPPARKRGRRRHGCG